MILLTDEEINDIVIIPSLNKRSEEDLLYYSRKRDEYLLKAQLKKVADILDTHLRTTYVDDGFYVTILQLWQALLEEAK